MFFGEIAEDDKETDKDLQYLGFTFNPLRNDDFDMDETTLNFRRERSRTERMANKSTTPDSMQLKREVSRQSLDIADIINPNMHCQLVKRLSIITTVERFNEPQPKDEETLSGTTAESAIDQKDAVKLS